MYMSNFFFGATHTMDIKSAAQFAAVLSASQLLFGRKKNLHNFDEAWLKPYKLYCELSSGGINTNQGISSKACRHWIKDIYNVWLW